MIRGKRLEPTTAISLNFLRISRDFADLGANNSLMNEDRPVLSAL